MHFIRQPFQDGVDTAFFYTGGTRQEILDEMISVIAQRIPFITMTGDEGSGKTVICRMLEGNLPPDLLLLLLSTDPKPLPDVTSGESPGDKIENNDAAETEINLDDLVVPRTLESFDDMVSIIFEQVVGRNSDDAGRTDTESILEDIVKNLRVRGKRLLIVFDEAEKIYLAPLERLRRLLDQVNEDSVIVQLLFSGRPLLTENFEQLSIVTFKEIEERHFVLQPLDSEATQEYLNHCMEIGTGEEADFFSREIVDRIFSVAKGNFTKINSLAREYLKAEKLDTTFLKLLDTHKDIEIEPPEDRPRRSRVSSGMPKVDLDFLKLPSFKPQWLLYGGGVCAVVLLVLLIFGRPSDESGPEQENPDVPVLELKNIEPLETAAVPVPPDRPVGDSSETSVKVEKMSVVPPADVPAADSGRKNLPQTAPKEVESAVVKDGKEAEATMVKGVKGAESTVEKDAKEAEATVEKDAKEPESAVEKDAKEPESAVMKDAKEPEATVVKDVKGAESTVVKDAKESEATVVKGVKGAESAVVKDAKEAEATMVKGVKGAESAVVKDAKEAEATVVKGEKEAESLAVKDSEKVESASVTKPKQVERVTEAKREEAALPPVVQPPVSQAVTAVKTEQMAAASKAAPAQFSSELEKNQVREKDNPPLKEEKESEKGAVPPSAPKNETGQPAVKAKIVVKPLREKKELQQPGEVTILENRNKKVPVADEKVPVADETVETPVVASPVVTERTAEEIYRERLAAGARWLIGQHDETYTVQLMVLASDHAEAHLTQMLDSEDYRSVADNLYILRRLGTLPTVKLFYGEYQNLAAARKARNTLPIFLRDKQPFAVAIPDAVKGSGATP